MPNEQDKYDRLDVGARRDGIQKEFRRQLRCIADGSPPHSQRWYKNAGRPYPTITAAEQESARKLLASPNEISYLGNGVYEQIGDPIPAGPWDGFGEKPHTTHFAGGKGPHLLKDRHGNTALCGGPGVCEFCERGVPPSGDHCAEQVDTIDPRHAVITEEMPIEEAKRRFPNWSPERWKEICDAEQEALDGTGGILAVSPEIYAEMQKTNQEEEIAKLQKIPGVTTGAEIKPAPPRVCGSCGEKFGKHKKNCREGKREGARGTLHRSRS